MAIPDYQSLMLPLLRYLADGKGHSVREAASALADHFGLSNEERSAMIASGEQSVLVNRVGWARTYLTGLTQWAVPVWREQTP
jgi:restriction system protein